MSDVKENKKEVFPISNLGKRRKGLRNLVKILPYVLGLILLGLFLTMIGSSPEYLERFKDNYQENGRLAYLSVAGTLVTVVGLLTMMGMMFFSMRDITDVDEEIGSSVDAIDDFSGVESSGGNSTDLDWQTILGASRMRLKNETRRLSTRSTLNLMAGVFFSGVSIAALFYLVLQKIDIASSTSGASEIFRIYVPRFSVVLLVQLLATFFLRMYVRNEQDILKNKNELTNIELRMAAISLLRTKGSGVSKIQLELIKEERNFVLKKNEKSMLEDKDEVVMKAIEMLQSLTKVTTK